MKTRMQVESPRNVEMTMTITMTVDEWDRLATQIFGNRQHPSSQLYNEIRRLVRHATQTFTADPIPEPIED